MFGVVRVVRLGLATVGLLVLALGSSLARAESDIGVVLMHGKQSQPGSPPGLSQIAERLRAVGIKVIVPQMPWANGQWEHIDVTVEQAYALIDDYVAQLKAQGAGRIVVAGHSLGGNIALSYAVARSNVAGVVMLSPGHAPGFFFSKSPEFRSALAKARALVEGGQGAQPFSGPDDNQGRSVILSTTAAVYYSWMAPTGLASMNQQASSLPAAVPVMMVMGKSENALANIQASVYQPAAKNPYSIFLAVSGDHKSATEAAVIDTVSWIKNLPQ